MTINEQMEELINELVAKFGTDYIISRKEIQDLSWDKYRRKPGSIIPSDYCYNRVNNGISLDKPALFEFLGKGKYRCLGSNYPYNGPIYHKPRGYGEFIVGKCVNGNRVISSDDIIEVEEIETNNTAEIKEKFKHKTGRNPSMKLRFEILKRDNFKCSACGASPATDPTVQLHIDHIMPWSKGGETTKDNLQTLCSTCNFGKGNSL